MTLLSEQNLFASNFPGTAEIGRTKSEVAYGTQLEGCPQAVAFALLGVNEGTVVRGQSERGDQIPRLDIIGKTDQPFPLFGHEKGAGHGRRASMIQKGVRNWG